jgi:dihydroorotase-like cyclic amidohydrolase
MPPTTGTATGNSPERTERMFPSENHSKVFNALVERKAMAFLELTSVCAIEDDELKEIIDYFADEGVVSVLHPENVFKEIVILLDRGFTLAKGV